MWGDRRFGSQSIELMHEPKYFLTLSTPTLLVPKSGSPFSGLPLAITQSLISRVPQQAQNLENPSYIHIYVYVCTSIMYARQNTHSSSMGAGKRFQKTFGQGPIIEEIIDEEEPPSKARFCNSKLLLVL